MAIEVLCPGCFQTMSVPEQFAGRRIKCKACGASAEVPEIDAVVAALAEIAEAEAGGASSPDIEEDLGPAPPGRPRPKQYRVVTLKDKWFSGKFDPDKIEERINALARQGYTLKAVATASLNGMGRDEVLIFMER
jgi:hypothetical protein